MELVNNAARFTRLDTRWDTERTGAALRIMRNVAVTQAARDHGATQARAVGLNIRFPGRPFSVGGNFMHYCASKAGIIADQNNTIQFAVNSGVIPSDIDDT